MDRYGMTSPPEVGGQPGDYEERWAQWFLERSFFRDFVYRNARGKKKGTELADALVLFSDVALLVQVKAQCGNHNPVAWATEKLLDALKQLKATHEQLGDGGITKLDHQVNPEGGIHVNGLSPTCGHERAALAARMAAAYLCGGYIEKRRFSVKARGCAGPAFAIGVATLLAASLVASSAPRISAARGLQYE